MYPSLATMGMNYDDDDTSNGIPVAESRQDRYRDLELMSMTIGSVIWSVLENFRKFCYGN